VQFCAFDVLAMDGDDLRHLPLSMRKANLARLLAHDPMASSSATLNRARSGRTCFVPPAACKLLGAKKSQQFKIEYFEIS
jgi:bifunctional non-homologous end joining protein LigD